MLGLNLFLCKVEEFNKVVPKALVALGPPVSSWPGDLFVAGGDGGSQLSTLERQRCWVCNIEEQLWGFGAPGLLRINISVIEVFSQRRSCLVSPCSQTAVSNRVCLLWTPSKPGPQCAILHLQVFPFSVRMGLQSLLLLLSTWPQTNFSDNFSQVDLEG